MAFLYILCALLLLTKVNSNPVTEVNNITDSTDKDIEDVSNTTTLDAIKEFELTENINLEEETTTSTYPIDYLVNNSSESIETIATAEEATTTPDSIDISDNNSSESIETITTAEETTATPDISDNNSSESIETITTAEETTATPDSIDISDNNSSKSIEFELIETTTTEENSTTFDSTSDNDCSKCIETKFLNHYYAKGCKPIPNSNGCDKCPKKFDCSQKNNISYGNNECIYNGNKYRIGESIPVANPCQVCQCGYGFDARYHSGERISPLTTIHCITVECPEHFAVHKFPVEGLEEDFQKSNNCYNTYVKGKCCAVKKECPDSGPLLNSSVCVYNDKTYQIGEKIYPTEDRCKVCICDENWDPNQTSNNSGCYEVQCNLEIDYQLREGCIPIYHEKTCCPIEYHCPQREEHLTPDYERRQICSEPSDSGPCLGIFKRFYYDKRDGQCHSFVYGGCGGNDNNFRDLEECEVICIKPNTIEGESELTDIRSENMSPNSTEVIEDFCLFNGNKYSIGQKLDIGQNCVDCECRIPPDFTCVHQSCPSPPSTKCKVSFQQTSCCPVIDCDYEEKITDDLFNPESCPTPMCAEDCNFETYPDRCPDCVCSSDIELPQIIRNGIPDPDP